MYTLTAGATNRIDVWTDQADLGNYLYVRLRFVKQGKKAQIEQYVMPAITPFNRGVLLAFYIQPVGLPPVFDSELGNITELGNYTLYIEGSDDEVSWATANVNQAKILQPEETELVIDGGPAEDVFRGTIDGGRA
jgi:hypothetical protein